MISTKVCSTCKKKKKQDEFYYTPTWGIASRCKACTLKRQQEIRFERQGGRKNRFEKVEDTIKRGTKICCNCNLEKPINDFHKLKCNTKRGWAFRPRCILCDREESRLYGTNNKSRRNKRLRDYRKKNLGKMKVLEKKGRLKHKYKISIEDYEKMLQAQGGKCFLCGKEKKLVIDHCHKTGVVRKLLCHGCNTVLGKVESREIEKFEKYIQDHADVLLKIANQ